MKLSECIWAFSLLPVVSFADDWVPDLAFVQNKGVLAAYAAAPMWHFPSGTCLPSAAEDGAGHQTSGASADNCNIFALNHGCPYQPPWQGPRTPLGQLSDEPFPVVPTYYRNEYCPGDNSWRTIYYLYFKKDIKHMSDWEGIVLVWKPGEPPSSWVRDYVLMEQDGHHVRINWDQIGDTFNGGGDEGTYHITNRNHAKFYVGKFHHPIRAEWHTSSFKNTCPPDSNHDFRNDDYFLEAGANLRHTDALDPGWDWGSAGSPATGKLDPCVW